MTRRRRILVVMAVIAVPLLLLGYDRILMVFWDGRTELEVEFIISDAKTGDRIIGATVEARNLEKVRQENGNYEYVMAFSLNSDAEGVARTVCRRFTCGRESGLSFTNTFTVESLDWEYRVTANGYLPTEWAYIDAREINQLVKRVSPDKTKVIWSVLLRKKED